MASVKFQKKLIENPELRKIAVQTNRINDLISSLGKSSYLAGIALPARLKAETEVKNAENSYANEYEKLISLYNNLMNIYENRRSLDKFIEVKQINGNAVKTLSTIKQLITSKTKYERGIIASPDDVLFVATIFQASISKATKFVKLWYKYRDENIIEFIKNKYQEEYSGSGASYSWGSAPISQVLENEIDNNDNIDNNINDVLYTNKDLYKSFMELM